MAEVKFKRGTKEFLDSTPIRDGQLLYNIDNGDMFMDVGPERKGLNEKGYVTPEMFGAKGDGETDDTEAVQKAIDADGTFVANGRYRTTKPIYIYDREKPVYFLDRIIYTSTDAAIVYQGSGKFFYCKEIRSNGHGFVARQIENRSWSFGGNTIKIPILSAYLHCFLIESSPVKGNVLWNNVYVDRCLANVNADGEWNKNPNKTGDCIHLDFSASDLYNGYCNKNNFIGFNCINFRYGVYAKQTARSAYGNLFSSMSFETERIEGYTKNILLDGFSSCKFENITLSESNNPISFRNLYASCTIEFLDSILRDRIEFDKASCYNTATALRLKGSIINSSGDTISRDTVYTSYGSFSKDSNFNVDVSTSQEMPDEWTGAGYYSDLITVRYAGDAGPVEIKLPRIYGDPSPEGNRISDFKICIWNSHNLKITDYKGKILEEIPQSTEYSGVWETVFVSYAKGFGNPFTAVAPHKPS